MLEVVQNGSTNQTVNVLKLESGSLAMTKVWTNSNVFNERLTDAIFIETKTGVPMLATSSASECLIWDVSSDQND